MDLSALSLIPNIDKKELEQLSKKTVSIVGLGGIGSTIAQILVRHGIGVRIVDKDRVYTNEFVRQTLYRIDDVTKFKAKQAKKHLEEINPKAKVKSFHEELTKDNVFLLAADLIIDTSNNIETTMIIDDFAIQKEIPFLASNYSGTKGHVFVIDQQQDKRNPCIHCIKEKFSLPGTKEEGAYSPITTLIAALLANAALKNLLGHKNVHTLLAIDLYKTEIRHVNVEKTRGCTHCKRK